ncbi:MULTISPECIES: TetR/AcrR family transcriptional regulator [Pantoea]|uniref:TetR/AcrR family transcriptional regulator n=1 Tax=Pantoea TaxID=53335 RepID=UPI000B142752|nr:MULTISPECIES: TetR/AcrR family transcriptional regulator [Pantoea]
MKIKTQKPAPRARGRPRAEDAGQVDLLILNAATSLFLKQGFARTTMDQVAAASGTGKSSLYARYTTKQALFGAVVQRSIEMMFGDLTVLPNGADPAARLHHTGLELLCNLLHPRCIALMRMTAAEAENFPELAAMAYQVSLEGSVRCLSDALSSCEILLSDIQAKRFVELVLQPAAFKALYGADAQTLIKRCQNDISDAIKLLFPDGLPGT